VVVPVGASTGAIVGAGDGSTATMAASAEVGADRGEGWAATPATVAPTSPTPMPACTIERTNGSVTTSSTDTSRPASPRRKATASSVTASR
jgi:hypothetical protein